MQISALRRTLDQGRAQGSCIQTIPGRGYRFVAPVTRAVAAVEAAATELTLPDKPSIAVLPFANMSGDPEQEYFADGMVEEIITALSRIGWLFVIARNSSFIYKGQNVDIKRVGRELGVRYVLEGSVRRSARRVRITAQLIDATTGAHLWADRFEGPLEDVFELEEQGAIAVAGIIEPTLEIAEIHRSMARRTTDLTTYDLYLRALSLVWGWNWEGVAAGIEILGRAMARDSNMRRCWRCRRRRIPTFTSTTGPTTRPARAPRRSSTREGRSPATTTIPTSSASSPAPWGISARISARRSR